LLQDGIFSGYREKGFLALDGLADKAMLSRLQATATGLAARVRTLRASEEDFVLEAPTGGWLAWQRGEPALVGVVRSVSNAHLYEPDIKGIATECSFAQLYISPAVGRRNVEFVTSYYWAKPPVVGSAKPWHQDMAYAPQGFHEHYENVSTIWIAIDPAVPENGCLEFVLGSHKLGLVAHDGTAEIKDGEPRNHAASEYQVDVAMMYQGHPVETVPLSAGSAVMFDGYTVHRSSPNTSTAPRQAISLVFAY
jgi:ectoine hydroxylase